MYEKILKGVEDNLNRNYDNAEVMDYQKLSLIADLIIKIKTIKYMNLQTEILEASRKVSLN